MSLNMPDCSLKLYCRVMIWCHGGILHKRSRSLCYGDDVLTLWGATNKACEEDSMILGCVAWELSFCCLPATYHWMPLPPPSTCPSCCHIVWQRFRSVSTEIKTDFVLFTFDPHYFFSTHPEVNRKVPGDVCQCITQTLLCMLNWLQTACGLSLSSPLWNATRSHSDMRHLWATVPPAQVDIWL